jgi:hypothetical protein
MTCPEMKNNLAESVFESRPLSEDARKHLAECGDCAAELKEMAATWKLLDQWQAPEPSAFFDAKLYARLRAEQSNAPASLFERAKAWLLYSSNLCGAGDRRDRRGNVCSAWPSGDAGSSDFCHRARPAILRRKRPDFSAIERLRPGRG